MKRKKLVIAGAVLLLVLAGVLVFVNRNQSDAQPVQQGEQVQQPATQQGDKQVLEQEEKAFSIPGYINGVEKEEEQIVCGISLPYKIAETPILIEGIGQYSGPFVEDGSDRPMANVLAMVIKNDSDQVIEFAEIRFAVNEKEEAVFRLSTIPAGKEVIVLENTGRAFHKEEVLQYTDKMYAQLDALSVMEKQVKLSWKDQTMMLENLTEKNLGTVYVRYKSKVNEQYYMGGITYSCKLEHVKGHAKVKAQTGHFQEGVSEILMVEAGKE